MFQAAVADQVVPPVELVSSQTNQSIGWLLTTMRWEKSGNRYFVLWLGAFSSSTISRTAIMIVTCYWTKVVFLTCGDAMLS